MLSAVACLLIEWLRTLGEICGLFIYLAVYYRMGECNNDDHRDIAKVGYDRHNNERYGDIIQGYKDTYERFQTPLDVTGSDIVNNTERLQVDKPFKPVSLADINPADLKDVPFNLRTGEIVRTGEIANSVLGDVSTQGSEQTTVAPEEGPPKKRGKKEKEKAAEKTNSNLSKDQLDRISQSVEDEMESIFNSVSSGPSVDKKEKGR